MNNEDIYCTVDENLWPKMLKTGLMQLVPSKRYVRFINFIWLQYTYVVIISEEYIFGSMVLKDVLNYHTC